MYYLQQFAVADKQLLLVFVSDIAVGNKHSIYPAADANIQPPGLPDNLDNYCSWMLFPVLFLA